MISHDLSLVGIADPALSYRSHFFSNIYRKDGSGGKHKISRHSSWSGLWLPKVLCFFATLQEQRLLTHSYF